MVRSVSDGVGHMGSSLSVGIACLDHWCDFTQVDPEKMAQQMEEVEIETEEMQTTTDDIYTETEEAEAETEELYAKTEVL